MVGESTEQCVLLRITTTDSPHLAGSALSLVCCSTSVIKSHFNSPRKKSGLVHTGEGGDPNPDVLKLSFTFKLGTFFRRNLGRYISCLME